MTAKILTITLSTHKFMENTAQITTGMIYELLKEFKNDINRRFEDVSRRFEGIENRQAEDHKILMELWQDRNEVKVKYSKHLFISISILASLVSLIVSTFVVSFG